MKITIKHLGALDQAEFSLGDLTIICGENNTGKTYATYATYGFLDYWRSAFQIDIPSSIIPDLLSNGTVTINIADYVSGYHHQLSVASENYSSILARVFAGNETQFSQARFSVEVSQLGPQANKLDYQVSIGTAEKKFLQIHKAPETDALTIALIADADSSEAPPARVIANMISDAIKRVVFGDTLPEPFIASTERTGASIFQKELDFTRNRLVDLLGDRSAKIGPVQLLGKFRADYPIPVRKNVDFIRELPNLINRQSYVLKQMPSLLDAYSDIIGGEFRVSKDGDIQFIPNANRRIRLSLVESSSSVRSLLDVGFYLRHLAKPGDLLIIDEPELNLHPRNQRRYARLLASLVNLGIKVFITTHSDYIIKELNTLIMLGRNMPRMREIAAREKYRPEEMLSADRVRVYIAEEALVDLGDGGRKKRRHTLVPANINQELGIEARSFDDTINRMNKIQDEIVWGED